MAGEEEKTLGTIFTLLRQVASLKQVQDYLRAKDIHHSAGSWDDLWESRVIPAIKAEKLLASDLMMLLAESEEHGRQHVFLFKATSRTARALMSEESVRRAAHNLGISALLREPKVLDTPDEPTYTDIRWEESEGLSLIIKIVETKVSHEFCDERVEKGILTKTYRVVSERVVNVVKLRNDGLLQIRVGSRRNSSGGYEESLGRVLKMVQPFLDLSKFRRLSLGNVKNQLWSNRDTLGHLVRYSDATLKNDQGTMLRAATGTKEANLHDDQGASDGLAAFMKHEAYCDSSNIFFHPQDGGIPSKEIHVLMRGMDNEFALTVHCPKVDYEYVLRQIEALNTPVS